MPVQWKIKELLEQHNITTYRFMKASGLAKGTAYRLANGKTEIVNVHTLDVAIETLRELTGKPIDIKDVCKYIPRSKRQEGN